MTSRNQRRLNALHNEVSRVLCSAGVSSVPGLDLFESKGPFGRPFEGLETHHQQLSFYKTHFPFIVTIRCICCVRMYVCTCIVHTLCDRCYPLSFTHYILFLSPTPLFHFQEPVSIALGEQRVLKGSGPKRRCVVEKDNLIYVLLLVTLQSLLQNEGVLSEVRCLYIPHCYAPTFCDLLPRKRGGRA